MKEKNIRSTHASSGCSRRIVCATLGALPILFGLALPISKQANAQTDALPSWNEGASKQSIIEFVGRVTRQGGSDFVPPAERIATFDNDGTLWSEQPVPVQLA